MDELELDFQKEQKVLWKESSIRRKYSSLAAPVYWLVWKRRKSGCRFIHSTLVAFLRFVLVSASLALFYFILDLFGLGFGKFWHGLFG